MDKQQILCAFGGRPEDLGGYRNHNPFRLYVRAMFRDLIKARMSAGDVRLVCSLALGPGQWCAEVAREAGLQYDAVFVRDMEGKWPKSQKDHFDELKKRASGQYEATTSITDHMVSFTKAKLNHDKPLTWFVCNPRDQIAGGVARALVSARPHVDDGSLILDLCTPEEMPDQYRALAAMESLREAIPTSLLNQLDASMEAMMALQCGGDDTPLRKKVYARLRELLDLRNGLQRVLERT